MYKYEYETVRSELGGWGPFGGNSYYIDDYRAIIDRRAEMGYRFVCAIPTKQRGTGHSEELDLIFEIEV